MLPASWVLSRVGKQELTIPRREGCWPQFLVKIGSMNWLGCYSNNALFSEQNRTPRQMPILQDRLNAHTCLGDAS
jgi:hypothetical protein